jgi:retron-type reverse transcriptase
MGAYKWYAQIDIRGYFASIDHDVLLGLLRRKFKDRELLALLTRIIGTHRDAPGRGLPIGTLTSQHFANFYLAGADRLLLEICRVRGFVRYMDDLVWWANDRTAIRSALSSASKTHWKMQTKRNA